MEATCYRLLIDKNFFLWGRSRGKMSQVDRAFLCLASSYNFATAVLRNYPFILDLLAKFGAKGDLGGGASIQN